MRNSRVPRKALSVIGLIAAGALALTACAGAEDTGTDAENSTQEKLTIGISQFVQHPALDAATDGFKQAFIEAGYVEGDTVVFDEQNANAEVATATTIAQSFQDSNVDLVLAVATPSAQAAAQNVTNAPVLFTAVTDAVEADLVDSNEAPGGNVTGTSDINPVADQIELITEVVPDAKNIGIVYSSGEVNSQIQVDLAKEAAEANGLSIVETTVTTSADILTATESIINDVDAIYVPTDNVVVSGLGALVQAAESAQVPVFGAESGTVENGALVALSISYEKLGFQTGKMALEILEDGADTATMAVQTSDQLELILNLGAAERMGVKLSDDFVQKADKTIE